MTWGSAFKQAITEDDANSVVCPVRVIGIAAGVLIFVVIAYKAYDDISSVSLKEVGEVISAYLFSFAAAIGTKAKLGA